MSYRADPRLTDLPAALARVAGAAGVAPSRCFGVHIVLPSAWWGEHSLLPHIGYGRQADGRDGYRAVVSVEPTGGQGPGTRTLRALGVLMVGAGYRRSGRSEGHWFKDLSTHHDAWLELRRLSLQPLEGCPARLPSVITAASLCRLAQRAAVKVAVLHVHLEVLDRVRRGERTRVFASYASDSGRSLLEQRSDAAESAEMVTRAFERAKLRAVKLRGGVESACVAPVAYEARSLAAMSRAVAAVRAAFDAGASSARGRKARP